MSIPGKGIIEPASHLLLDESCETPAKDGEGQAADDDAVAKTVGHVAGRVLCSTRDIRLLPISAVMCRFAAHTYCPLPPPGTNR